MVSTANYDKMGGYHECYYDQVCLNVNGTDRQ